MRLKSTNGDDDFHTNHLPNAAPCFRSLLCKLMNKFILFGLLPYSMLLGEIRPTAKNTAGTKTISSNYTPAMNSSNLLTLFEYLILPHYETNLILNHNHFAYRTSAGWLNAITLLNELRSHHNHRHSDVLCTLTDTSEAYDWINIKTICTKLRTELP